MAIQLGQFKPLEHKHYTLAKTQGEYDEDAKREMAIDNNNFANRAVMANMEQQNANNRANAAIMEQRRQDETAQMNKEFDQQRQLGLDQANLSQQDIDNAYREKEFSLKQGDRAADNRRADIQLGLSQAQESRNQEAYSQAQQEKQQRLALAQFGSRLLSSEPDKDGRVDVTDNFDTINTLAGGGVDKNQFKRIYAQNTGEKTLLIGEGEDGKPMPVVRNGSPVAIHNEILKKSAMFANGDGNKKDYDFKTVRGGMDNEGNVLPDRIAKMNPSTGEIEFVDQPRAGGAQSQMTDEQKAAAFANALSSAMKSSQTPDPKQPGLGDVQSISRTGTEAAKPSIQELQSQQQKRYQENAARVAAKRQAKEQRAGLDDAVSRIQRDPTLTRQQKIEQINALTREAR